MWTAVAPPLAFGIVGAIHLLSVAPAFMPETLSRLYGIAPTDITLLVLMRHRALLLALVGILCLWALFGNIASLGIGYSVPAELVVASTIKPTN